MAQNDSTAQQLPSDFFERVEEVVGRKVADSTSEVERLKQIVRDTDIAVFGAIKDLSATVLRDKHDLEKDVSEVEKRVSEVETKTEEELQTLNDISTISNRLIVELGEMNSAIGKKIEDLDEAMSRQLRNIKQDVESIEKQSLDNSSGGGGSNLAMVGGGAAKQPAQKVTITPEAPPASMGKKILQGIPVLVKRALGGVGYIIGGLATELASQYAEATGYEQLAAGFDIAGYGLAGAGFGSLFGPAGTAAGAVGGVGYGLYQKGGQLMGNDLTPAIKELQEQAEQRQQNQKQEEDKPKFDNSIIDQISSILGVTGGGAAAGAGGKTAMDVGRNNNLTGGGGYANIPKSMNERVSIGVKAATEEFIKAGFSPAAAKAAAAGLIGNAIQESGLDPNKHHDNDTGYGLFGHRLDRREALLSHMAGAGKARNDYEEQVRFGAQELVTKADFAQLSRMLKGVTDPRMAADLIAKRYEKPLPSAANYGGRMANAASVFRQADTPDAKNVTASPSGEDLTPKGEAKGASERFEPASNTPLAKIPTGPVQTAGVFPSGNLVGLGKSLQQQGIRVSEHPAFGGVHGVHTKGSAHYSGNAIDVNVGTGVVEANDPVWGKKFDALAEQIRSAGYKVIWRAPGHYNHLHAELGGGGNSVKPEMTPGEAPPSSGPQAAPTESADTIGPIPQLKGGGVMPETPMTPMMGPIGGMDNPAIQSGMLNMIPGAGKLGGLIGMLSSMSGMMGMNMNQGGGLVPQIPSTPQLVMDQTIPTTGTDTQPQINNINMMSGGPPQGDAKPQNTMPMGARPDWLGHLAEGLMGSTYSGMGRVKSFGAGLGKLA